jgi:hypothetical protein
MPNRDEATASRAEEFASQRGHRSLSAIGPSSVASPQVDDDGRPVPPDDLSPPIHEEAPATRDVDTFRLELAADGHSARIHGAKGVSLELPVGAWVEVLEELAKKVSDRRAASGAGRPSFGPRPGRHGADWSPRESAALAKDYEQGATVAALALSHQRSTGAVEAQLLKLGLIAYGDCQYSGPRR